MPAVAITLSIGLSGCVSRPDASSAATPVVAAVAAQPYRIERYPKIEGEYTRLSHDQVQIGPYRMARIESEDADAFHVRVYELPAAPTSPNPAVAAVITPEVSLPSSSRFTLEPFDQGLPREEQWRDQLAVADIDGDGKPDIISAPARKSPGPPVVFRGNGAGQWQRWTTAVFPALGYDYGGAAVVDIDQDGRADLALAMHLRGFSVLRQTTPGHFERADAGLPALEELAQHGLSGVNVALDAADPAAVHLLLLDERARPRAAGQPRPLLHLYRWQADRWQPADPLPAVFAEASLARLMDAHISTPGVWVLLQDAAGGLRAAQLHAGSWQLHELPTAPGGCQLLTAAVARVDADALPDVAISCQRLLGQQWWSQVELLRSATGPLTLQAGTAAQSIRQLRFLRADPADAALHPDLALLGEDGELELLIADSGAGYSRDHAEPVPAWRAGCRGSWLHSADLDQDGHEELLAAFAGEQSVFQPGPGCRAGGGISAWKLLRTR